MNVTLGNTEVPHTHTCEWCQALYKNCKEPGCAGISSYGNCDLQCFTGKRASGSRSGLDVRPK